MKTSFFNKLKSTFNFSYLALLVLFCFAVSTSYMSLSYMAKYSTYAGSSPDSARSAEFDIKVDFPEGHKIELDVENWNDWRGEYPFSITNNSEVTVRYKVRVEFQQNLPSGITFGIPEMNNVWFTGYNNQKVFLLEVLQNHLVDEHGNPREDESILDPGEKVDLKLTFWPQKTMTVAFDTPANVTVIVEQLD